MILPRRMGLTLALTLPVLAAAVLAACARTAPPAPVMAGQSGQTRAAPITIAQPSAPAQHADAAPVPSGSSWRAAPHPDHVTVRAGETLYAISRRYGVPVRSLIEANGLAPPYALAAGRRLAVPQVRLHAVQPGETLYSVSRLYGIDTTTLARSNALPPPYTVFVGQSLVLPAPVQLAEGVTAPTAAPRRRGRAVPVAGAGPAAERLRHRRGRHAQ